MKLLEESGRSGQRRVERLLVSLEGRGAASLDRVMPQVERIVSRVRKGGDEALLRYRAKFDATDTDVPLRVPVERMQRAWEEISPELQAALRAAEKNIRAFAERQMPQQWDIESEAGEWPSGAKTGQRVRALDAVGCYVPGGRHPLPSSLLMTVIPAQVAGVRRIAVASPSPARETLAAAGLLGVEHFFHMGGAHAIAALAYGTQTIGRVDKIVGPGNLYVTAAKKTVAFDCGIDMLAGPTEIVVASETGDPAWIAADLVAQAEHDVETLAVLVTTRKKLAKQVLREVKRQSGGNSVARQALERNGYVIVADTIESMHAIVNRLAAEHLTVDSESDLGWVRHAGSVFLGRWSAQPLGDYISGPNHTLPTGGLARVRGGLSVMDFVRLMTVQSYTDEGVRSLGPAAAALAEAEGLTGHAAAIRTRLAAGSDHA
jgi:histidinol dehydrogenase